MEKQTFSIADKTISLYASDAANAPLVVLHCFEGDGEDVARLLAKKNAPAHHLLAVGSLDWEDDMTPWENPSLSKGEPPATGGADDYLRLLLDEILPHALKRLPGVPSYTAIAGYSLAGLFALYTLYRCDRFSAAASMSGSLWFPGFVSYAKTHDLMKKPDKIYLSLGNKEAKTRHPLLKTVLENTENLADDYRARGIDTVFTLNEGNHFKEPDERTAKGIMEILS